MWRMFAEQKAVMLIGTTRDPSATYFQMRKRTSVREQGQHASQGI
jgi:hypothetical protein